jgi:guanylate kinase
MNKNGLILVVSGPAGSGKGTVNRILRDTGDYVYSVSRTTRAPRPGEVDGSDYLFVTREQFFEYLEQGDFLEHNEYCGNFYGTPLSTSEQIIAQGKNIILEIDVNGAAQVKKKYPDTVMIFITAPSIKELAARLKNRGTEDEKTIRKRLETAKKEAEFIKYYEHLVVNDIIDDAAERLDDIITTEHNKVIY